MLYGVKSLQVVVENDELGDAYWRATVHSRQGEREGGKSVWVEGLLQHSDLLIVRGGVHHQAALVSAIKYTSVTGTHEQALLSRSR